MFGLILLFDYAIEEFNCIIWIESVYPIFTFYGLLFFPLFAPMMPRFTFICSFFLCSISGLKAQSQSSYFTSFPKLDVINVQTLFDPIVPNATLIALGDAAPGTEEGFQTKSTIIQNLIFKNYYRHLILQMDFMDAWHIESYISGETNMGFSQLNLPVEWNNSSFRNLIAWIYERNMGTSDDKQKVHVWGMNACSVPLSKPNEMVIQQFAPQLINDVNAIFNDLLKSRRQKINEIKELADLADGSNHEWTYQTLLVRNVLASYQSALDGFSNKSIFTEEYTANMILELMGQLDNSERFVLWAENDRIDKRPSVEQSFGIYLDKNLGKKYVAIAGDFYQGSAQLYPLNDSAGIESIQPVIENISPKPTSISDINKSNNKGILWLDVALAPKEWVKQHRVYTSILYNTKPKRKGNGVAYYKVGSVWNGTKSFDYFLILNEVHPVIP